MTKQITNKTRAIILILKLVFPANFVKFSAFSENWIFITVYYCSLLFITVHYSFHNRLHLVSMLVLFNQFTLPILFLEDLYICHMAATHSISFGETNTVRFSTCSCPSEHDQCRTECPQLLSQWTRSVSYRMPATAVPVNTVSVVQNARNCCPSEHGQCRTECPQLPRYSVLAAVHRDTVKGTLGMW